jgi:L-threonylcarbamoyladenylate synthase
VKVFRTETLQDADYAQLASLLQSGGVIAFPTDTAYGLGADPFNEAAIDRIFRLKGRAETKPILLVVDSLAMAKSVSVPPRVFRQTARQFWPGPLTMILRAAKSLPPKVTAGTNTIGLRWPVADCATKLLKHFKRPITATSANRSGLPSAITVEEVREQFDESLDALIDGGTLPSRGGSTLLDLTVEPPVLLREGPVSFESLQQFFDGKIRRQP